MKIGNNCGHTESGLGSGAVGLIDESLCTRQISRYFVELLKRGQIDVVDCTVSKSSSYLSEVVKMANKQKLDYVISHHLNHSEDSSANGVEVWVYDIHDKVTCETAKRICDELSKLGLRNRGVKESKKLYFLKHTNSKAILIEYLFCSNKADVSKYNPQKLAQATYMGLTNSKLPNGSVEVEDNFISRYQYKNGAYDCKAIVVNCKDGLNIRKERGTIDGKVSSEVIGKLIQGSTVEVDYCIDNWFSVWENGELGYIFGEYIKLI